MDDSAPVRPTATLLVCRGCCCGTEEKHPRVDHHAQIEHLREAVAKLDGARVRVTECLGPCERSNVVAVRHRDIDRPGFRVGTTWLGGLLEPEDTTQLADWLAHGAVPEHRPVTLDDYVFDPAEVSVTPDHEITYLDATIGAFNGSDSSSDCGTDGAELGVRQSGRDD